MGAIALNPVMPKCIDMQRRHSKRQLAQHQFISDARDADKMARQHREQVGIGHHPARRKKLIHRQHHAPLAPQGSQRLVNKAGGAP